MFVRTLDRQRYGDFAKAYLICFVSLIGLYVVIDAFTKFDEFSEVQTEESGALGLLAHMAYFYGIRLSLFYDQLCSVIMLMAAVFTVTWMQRNNELLAMLAAGISLPRIVRPVIVCCLIVSALAMANQELVMPRFAHEFTKSPDDDGTRPYPINSAFDRNGVVIHGEFGTLPNLTIEGFSANVPASLVGSLLEIRGERARYIPPETRGVPHAGGWLIIGRIVPAQREADGQHLIRLTRGEAEGYPPLEGIELAYGETEDALYFLKTDLNFYELTRGRKWYFSAATIDRITGLNDPANGPERMEMAVFLHGRLLRPLMSLALLMVSLPLVLGGLGRNMFLNLGISLLVSGIFYASVYLAQYIGSGGWISPELAAWAPLIGFGTMASIVWQGVRS